MTTLSKSPFELFVPQEILGIICQNTVLTQYDLSVLCTVSRAVCAEASRILYNSVELRSVAKLDMYRATIERRPDLAVGLRRLVLELPHFLVHDDQVLIAKMLSLLKDLQELQAFCQNLKHGPIEHGWYLEGHAFKLTTFVNRYFSPRTLVTFFKRQSTLETLLTNGDGTIGLPAQVEVEFPYLKNLSANARIVWDLINTPSTRESVRLERLQLIVFEMENKSETFFERAVIRFGGTLTSLSVLKFITSGARVGWDFDAIVACAATSFPSLKFLEIKDYTTTTEYQDSSLFTSSGFPRIETIILQPPIFYTGQQSQIPKASVWRDWKMDAGPVSVAAKFMEALPTLKRLVIIWGGPGSKSYEYKRTLAPTLNSWLSDALGVNDLEMTTDEWLKMKL